MTSSTIRRTDRFLAYALCVALVASTQPAHADVPAADAAVARGLFDEARALMHDQRWADACPKLEASERMDPGKGTEFNLADCYEHVGRFASAWALFEQVAAASHASNQASHEALARQRAEAVSARVARLVVEVPEASRVEKLEIARDGEALLPATWSSPLRLDPGKHTITARAPDRVAWETTLVLAEGQSFTVTIPPLAKRTPDVAAVTPAAPSPEPVAPPSAEPSPEPIARADSSRRTVALAVGGVGLAGIAAGGVLGVLSLSAHNAAKTWCSDTTNACTQQQGVDDRSSAVARGNASTILFVAGGLLVSTGAVLWFTAPSSSSRVGVTALPGGSAAISFRRDW